MPLTDDDGFYLNNSVPKTLDSPLSTNCQDNYFEFYFFVSERDIQSLLALLSSHSLPFPIVDFSIVFLSVIFSVIS